MEVCAVIVYACINGLLRCVSVLVKDCVCLQYLLVLVCSCSCVCCSMCVPGSVSVCVHVCVGAMYRRSPCARGRVHFDFSEEVIRKLHAVNHGHTNRLGPLISIRTLIMSEM